MLKVILLLGEQAAASVIVIGFAASDAGRLPPKTVVVWDYR
jgi:hypothetical protein